MENLGINSAAANQNQIPENFVNQDVSGDKNQAQKRFDDLSYQAITPERQTAKSGMEENKMMKLIEKVSHEEFTQGAKPAQAAATTNIKEADQTNKTSAAIGGASEDLVREIKKKTAYKVAGANAGDMKEVDSHKEKDDTDPQKEKKHKEFMFDLMALLVRLGLIKKKK